MQNPTRLNLYAILFLFLIFQNPVQAQTYTVSGYVTDAASGEEIINAYIIKSNSDKGSVSNVYGFYSLSLPAGKHAIIYKSVGYQDSLCLINLTKNLRIDIELSRNNNEIEAVTVTAKGDDKNISAAETGVTAIDPEYLKVVPVLFGEQDILKTIQLLPGIKTAGEGGSGFFVRGGGTDENLILLDEAPVYNASHLMGFFSVFNSDAVKDAKIYKGTAPAQYGGRLSSVLDIKMKEGNKKKYEASGGIGLISSRLNIEGPLIKDKGSFILSGRRTYADMFLVFAKKEELKNSTLYFYDFNAKANYKINENNRLFISGYFGRDVFSFDDIMQMDWGNSTATLRFNHLFSDKLFSNTSLIFSDYDYKIGFAFGFDEDAEIWINSRIKDWNFKEDFQYFINSDNMLRFGINAVHHTFKPGEIKTEGVDALNDIKVDEKYTVETAAYLSHEWSVADNFKLVYGLRFSNNNVIGPGTVYEFDEYSNPVDSTVYDDFSLIKAYYGLEPRASVNYILNTKSSVKLAYTRNRQYMHLLQNSSASGPTDIWYPTTAQIKPGLADLYSAGYYRNFKNNMFETSFELYYKDIKSTIDYRNGANIMLNKYLEAEIIQGTGYSYGAEFYLKKQKGKFSGWLSYTWSRTMRVFDELNNGDPFPARQDRIHDFSVTGIYNFSPRLSASASWVFYTGDAVTFPSGRYVIDGYIINLYTERNGYRMPDYHRADIALTLKGKEKKHWSSSWNFSIYNVYARKNAYDISFRPSEDDPTKMEAVRTALFRMIPSVSYSFKIK